MISPYNLSPSPFSKSNESQILNVMLRIWSQFLYSNVPSTLAYVLCLGICSGSGRERLGSHNRVPTKRGIGLALKLIPNLQLLRFEIPFQITHYLKAFSPLSILNTQKLGSSQIVQLFQALTANKPLILSV